MRSQSSIYALAHQMIRSPRNRAVVEASRLHRARDRRRTGLTLVEGPHLVQEAVAAGVSVRQTFVLADDSGAFPNVRLVDPEVMKHVAGTEHPRGPVAVIEVPSEKTPPTDQHLLVLWQIGDPGNVGTIIRTAGAFGLGVVIGPETADPWSPKALRAGAGGQFRAPISTVDTIEALEGWRLAATVVNNGKPPSQLEPGPWAVLLGSEPHGLDSAVTSAADVRVTIPLPGGAESLNVAAVAAIVAHELAGAIRRQTHH